MNFLEFYEYHLDADTTNHEWHSEGYPGGGAMIIEGLFEFTTFTFTNAGYTGRYGPPYSALLSSYSPYVPTNPWINTSNYFLDAFHPFKPLEFYCACILAISIQSSLLRIDRKLRV